MQEKLPIGIFDSGFGGLSVAKSIHNLLPKEDLLYVADSAFTPYGDMQEIHIVERAILISDFLINKKHSKAIVVACNTATAFSVNVLRERFNIPVIGMEPAVKPAIKVTLNNKVGVLATSGNIKKCKILSSFRKVFRSSKIFYSAMPRASECYRKGKF